MKIGEARQTYNYQIRSYNEQKWALSKEKAELEKKYDKVYLCNRKNRGVEKISEE